MFPGLKPLWFLSVPSSKAAVSGHQGVKGADAFFDDVISDISQSPCSDTPVTWFEGIARCIHALYFEKATNLYVLPDLRIQKLTR